MAYQDALLEGELIGPMVLDENNVVVEIKIPEEQIIPQTEIPPKNKGGRPRKSDFSPQDAMLKEYQASTEMCQRIRQMIDKQYDLIVKQLGPTTNPRDRIALTEGLVDLYEKLVRTMGMAWKSMATKDPKPEEGEISLEELLELGGKKSANKSKH